MSQSISQMVPENYDYDVPILGAIENMFNYYTDTHKRTLVVRFDVRYPVSYGNDVKNEDISKCMRKVMQYYKRLGNYDPFSLWVREQGNSQHPHYHCCLLLNGKIIQNPYGVMNTVERLWGNTIGEPARGLINHCTKSKYGTTHENGIMLRSTSEDYMVKLQEVINQVTYLAKVKGKGAYNDGLRNFGMSRIPNSYAQQCSQAQQTFDLSTTEPLLFSVDPCPLNLFGD